MIKKIGLKKGTYNIFVTGLITIQNYTQSINESFILHAEFSKWHSKRIKAFINSMNYYAYPFNGTLIIESKEAQSIEIKIQKYTKFYPVTLQNLIITVDKVSHFVKTK